MPKIRLLENQMGFIYLSPFRDLGEGKHRLLFKPIIEKMATTSHQCEHHTPSNAAQQTRFEYNKCKKTLQ